MTVAVIIAAKDAGATIARAIRSALAEAEVSEVIVVDDGSTDDTSRISKEADDGSGRLSVTRLPANRGPSAARNLALDQASSDYIAILDADDVFLPGRFARLLSVPDWDIIADNILFVPDDGDGHLPEPPRTSATQPYAIDLIDFIDGCVIRNSRARSQLGFLKPVIRRAFLTGDLRYDERLRLGEDFVLYVELLRRGARFVLTPVPGYVAVERSTSLSARHGTADLAALLAAERMLLSELSPSSPAAASMARRVEETNAKHALRAFLDMKRSNGFAAGLAWLLARPDAWRHVIRGIAGDKWLAASASWSPAPSTAPRLLFGERAKP